MKIVVTGTHFTTALAVIEELKKYNAEVVYVGRASTQEGDSSPSAESQVLPKNRVKFLPIIAGRLQRMFTIYTIPALLKLPVGFFQSFKIILLEKPDVILSFGGYISVPVVIMAWFFSIPVIIHEQTLVTGLANKINSLFANKVAISFSESGLKGEKVVLTGNPIKKAISLGVNVRHTGSVPASHLRIPTILVTGGNQGSHVINLAVEECLDKLTKIAHVIHQTGDSKFRDYERLVVRGNDGYKVMKWIPNMADVMKKADLVVSRAGINTLSELAYLEKPALVIPYPYLYQDEQNKNAEYFEKLGLVRILPQNKLNSELLLKAIKSCLNDLNHFNKVAIRENAKKFSKENFMINFKQTVASLG